MVAIFLFFLTQNINQISFILMLSVFQFLVSQTLLSTIESVINVDVKKKKKLIKGILFRKVYMK